MSETNVLIFSLLGGIIPAFFWLWFWVREDRLRPEPQSTLFSAFVGGIIAVLLALFFEQVIYFLLADANPDIIRDFPESFKILLQNFVNNNDLINFQTNVWSQIQNSFNNLNYSQNFNFDIRKILLVVVIAPIVEELLKLILTYNICLRRKVNDEPIDASIYMLTAALGFAAIETALIITEPFSNGNVPNTLIAINFRSIGPMLIHLISSSVLGLFIGLAFYKSKIKKFLYLILGLIVAIILHSLFNFFIMLNDSTRNIAYFWTACLGTWLLVIVLLIFFERVKKVVKK